MKYLVIGAEIKAKSIISYKWENIPPDLNLADFDIVIINLYAINEDHQKIEYANLEGHSIYNLVFNQNAEIIVIGIPDRIKFNNRLYDLLWWLPGRPKYTKVKGDTIKTVSKEFDYYFKLLDKWYFHFENSFNLLQDVETRNIFKKIDIYGDRISPIPFVIADNLYGKPLSLGIRYIISPSTGKESIPTSASIILLPPPTKVNTEDAIIEILKKRYEILLIQDEPEWVKEYKLPVQIDVEKRLNKTNEEIVNLNKQKDEVETELQEQLFFRKLLYEKGEILENVVLNSLEILGAKIQEIKDKKAEDGRITDPYGRDYIIEIKGSNSQLKRGNIRQLDDWIKKAILDEDWKGKGVIIGNYFSDMKLDERKYPIHANEINPLERFKFSVLKTTQLFKALQLFQEKKHDKKMFWDTLYNTNGLCDLPDI